MAPGSRLPARAGRQRDSVCAAFNLGRV